MWNINVTVCLRALTKFQKKSKMHSKRTGIIIVSKNYFIFYNIAIKKIIFLLLLFNHLFHIFSFRISIRNNCYRSIQLKMPFKSMEMIVLLLGYDLQFIVAFYLRVKVTGIILIIFIKSRPWWICHSILED